MPVLLLPLVLLLAACFALGGYVAMKPTRFESINIQPPAVSTVELYELLIPARDALGSCQGRTG